MFVLNYLSNFVFLKLKGKEKTRLSCLMTCTASGKKLPILTVVPRKKKIQSLEEMENMIIIYETKGIVYIRYNCWG